MHYVQRIVHAEHLLNLKQSRHPNPITVPIQYAITYRRTYHENRLVSVVCTALEPASRSSTTQIGQYIQGPAAQPTRTAHRPHDHHPDVTPHTIQRGTQWPMRRHKDSDRVRETMARYKHRHGSERRCTQEIPQEVYARDTPEVISGTYVICTPGSKCCTVIK